MSFTTSSDIVTENNVSQVLEKHLLESYPDKESRMYIVLNWSNYLEGIKSDLQKPFDNMVKESFNTIVEKGFSDELFLQLYRLIEGVL